MNGSPGGRRMLRMGHRPNAGLAQLINAAMTIHHDHPKVGCSVC
jgi:hypothetical protein